MITISGHITELGELDLGFRDSRRGTGVVIETQHDKVIVSGLSRDHVKRLAPFYGVEVTVSITATPAPVVHGGDRKSSEFPPVECRLDITQDKMYPQMVEYVRANPSRITSSNLQRVFKLGMNRTVHLIACMIQENVIERYGKGKVRYRLVNPNA